MKRPLIVANWKMNVRTLKEAEAFQALFYKHLPSRVRADIVIAPPFPFLYLFSKYRAAVLGAQDLFWESEGAYTGEVSASMLKSMGVVHVIIGHSERRHLGETDEMVNKKIKLALKSKIRPIVCVGEVRRDHDGAFFSFVREQLEKGLSKVKKSELARITIAYEPVWAIGTGKSASPRDASEMSLFIRKTIAGLYDLKAARSLTVLYGGSVDPKNARSFLQEREIGGLLVGGASKDAKKFGAVIACV